MARKILWTCIIAFVIALLPEPANADKLRWRSRVRDFPSNWCLIEGEQRLVFQAEDSSARITITADDVPDQRIDNIYVVKRSIYESFLVDPFLEETNVQCSETKVYNFNASGSNEAFLATFDSNANDWELNGASWNPESAPRSPIGEPDNVGGSIRLDPGNSASVLISGLQPGVEYVVGGWWFTQLEGQQLTIDVETEPEIALFPHDGRFEVKVDWFSGQGSPGVGRGISLTEETGYVWFFNPQNVEVVLKVLNGCGLNSRYWVFIAGLTDVQVDIEVTDTFTGATKRYHNPLGARFQPVQDTSAFATCP
ncbi:MAG: hypothetical protein ACJ76J_05405 [Thermoanaerobaculia bacterium]